MRDPAAGLGPDLRAGAELVREPVRRVGVLIDVDIPLGIRGRAPLRLTDRAVGPGERVREDDLRAERASDALSLERDLVGHAELQRMAADRADHREGDAGVAAGRVEHEPAADEPAAFLRIDDHPKPRAVLHAPTGVGALELRPDLAAQPGGDASQRHERRVADALEDRSAHTVADQGHAELGHARSVPAG